MPPSMTKLEKIEQQIAELDPADLKKLSEWLAEHREAAWDRPIEKDINAGRPGAHSEEALAASRAGRLRLLRELKGAGPPRSAADIDALVREIRGDD